ncbi:hypothetical protein POAN111098_01145 [Polynucleobacter antarcticus]
MWVSLSEKQGGKVAKVSEKRLKTVEKVKNLSFFA